jgi:hypothetical protein
MGRKMRFQSHMRSDFAQQWQASGGFVCMVLAAKELSFQNYANFKVFPVYLRASAVGFSGTDAVKF